jgi:hypothetical protein
MYRSPSLLIAGDDITAPFVSIDHFNDPEDPLMAITYPLLSPRYTRPEASTAGDDLTSVDVSSPHRSSPDSPDNE